MRYFLHLAYNGAQYCGWQRQPNAIGVQQILEEALSTILRVPTAIIGAGRTDAGVHAACMYAHFDSPFAISDPDSFIRSLNHLCGRDISVYKLIHVADDSHARFDAVSRTYKYFVTETKSPFLYPYSWYTSRPLDYDMMNVAARHLLEITDFTSFAKLHSDAKTYICDVREAYWENNGRGQWVFTITADRFLRNMVRAVVGTLVEVGRGKMNIDRLIEVVKAKDRCAAGTSMPGHALFLWDIVYPYIEKD